MEGWFLFRYRVFNLFSATNGSQPILAECWGGPFRIYATKQYPGLEPSTELTKVTNDCYSCMIVFDWWRCSLIPSYCIVIMCLSVRGKCAGSAGRTRTTTLAPALTKTWPIHLELQIGPFSMRVPVCLTLSINMHQTSVALGCSLYYLRYAYITHTGLYTMRPTYPPAHRIPFRLSHSQSTLLRFSFSLTRW